MSLKDQFLSLVIAVVIAVSLFAGLVVIVDNVQATSVRPTAAVSAPFAHVSEHGWTVS